MEMEMEMEMPLLLLLLVLAIPAMAMQTGDVRMLADGDDNSDSDSCGTKENMCAVSGNEWLAGLLCILLPKTARSGWVGGKKLSSVAVISG